jgi:DNA-binding Lrp family transcriptional regulator
MPRITQGLEEQKPKIDLKDKKILILLSENSRMPISEIAKKVQLSRDMVAYKIKRLISLGVILGFYPEINFRLLGYRMYHVFLLLDSSKAERHEEFLNALRNHPNITSVLEYTDQWDIEFCMIVKGMDEFDELSTEIFSKFADLIQGRSKLAVMNTYYSIQFPYNYYLEFNENIPKPEVKKIALVDSKDMKILAQLALNSRASTYEIAQKVKLSPDAIGLRIKKMLATGVIEKFTILPNLSLLHYKWYTFVVQMRTFDKKNEARFKKFVEDHPFIIRGFKTLGNWDLIIYIIADNQIEFHDTVKQIKSQFSSIIKKYAAYVAFQEHYFNPMPKILLER